MAREKGHADKLRTRISDMNAAIAKKEVEYQEAKKLYEALARSNRKFEEGATKFREIYIKVESLEKERQKYQEELAELRPNVQEIPGTLLALCDRRFECRFFDHYKTLTSNWTSESKTSMLILLKRGMFGGARRRMNRIKRMKSLPLGGNM